jgi:predicted transcriptional regulator
LEKERMAAKVISPSKNGLGPHTPARPLLMIALAAILIVQTLTILPSFEVAAAPESSRIIVVSNETSIPLALGTPSLGLEPFSGVLINRQAVHLTGQVVDGNYTPLWQPGSEGNHAIGDAVIHWSFDAEPARSHTITTDDRGVFSILLTPIVQAPATTQLKFWFDGKSDTLYGIPIYPQAQIVYTISVSEGATVSVQPAQTRAMAGDTILVQGVLSGPSGKPVAGEGLIGYFDDTPAYTNPHAGWFVDNVGFGPLGATFENGPEGFVPGGKGTWTTGIPTAGPRGGASSVRCAGSSMAGGYAPDADGYLVSSTVDLTDYDQPVLLFDTWSDLAPSDEISVELSNDNGLTWPVHVAVTTGATWNQVTIPAASFFGTAYGTVQFAHKSQVKFRFKLTGHTMPLTTDADGKFEFTYTIPEARSAGAAVISVEHPASSNFAQTSGHATIDVARETLVQTIGPDVMFRGTASELKARLLDIDGTAVKLSITGQAVKSPTLKFWLRQGDKESFLGEKAVDNNGYAAIGYQPSKSDPLGSGQVVYTFGGSEFYSPSEATRDVAFKAHTEVSITSPKAASLLAADTLEVEGRVQLVRLESADERSQDPVFGTDLKVLLDGSDIGTVSTDSNGRFLFYYDVRASGIDLGKAVVKVLFSGDIVYEPSEATVDFSILSNTNITAQPRTISKGSSAVIDGVLTSNQGGVQGIVEVSVGSVPFRKVVTGATGGFAVTYDVPWTTEAGPLQVTLTYRGSKVYRPTATTVMYTVVSDTMFVVPKEPLVAHRGTGITLKGTLVDAWGDVPGLPIAGVPVTLNLPDGTVGTAMTNMNGNFTYYYTVPGGLVVGDTEAVATFSGAYRGSSSVHIPLKIASSTTLYFAEVGPTPLTDGASALIKVLLIDDAGSAVAGKDLSVVGGAPGAETVLFEGPTDSAGALAFRTLLNGTGSQTITVSFKGDDNYEASEASDYISIGPAPKVTTPIQRQPTVVLGGGLSLVLILALAMTESGKYFLFRLFLVPLYTKLKKEDVLDHFVRGQIYGLIRLQPGAHYNFIKKKLDIKNGVLSYHLSTLEREGYILSEMDGIYKRFYPNHVKFEVDYPIFLSKIQERIVDFIKSKPGLTQKEVALELGLSTSTANDNIQVLSQAQILELRRDGKRTRCYLVES